MSAESLASRLTGTQLYALGLVVFDGAHRRPDGLLYAYDPGASNGGKAGGAYVALDEPTVASLERLGLVSTDDAWVRATDEGRAVDRLVAHA